MKILQLFIIHYVYVALATNETQTQDVKNDTLISRRDLYKYGFKIKRAEQVKGAKRIAKMEDYQKKYSMVKILLEKMFKVLMSAKVKVMESGFIPGSEFPDDKDFLDVLGHVFENVAFFGDLLLRCPDITHKLYDANREWKITMNWGVVFSNESGIFEEANFKMLNLVAQELEIIPREENYVNPYKEAYIKAEQKKKEEEAERVQAEKNAKLRKKKTKKRRGPKLGGSSEL